MKFGDIELEKDKPLYFIADIAANHDGSLKRAFELIEKAKEVGADAAKFQNFIASKIVSKKGFDSLGGQLSHQSNWKKSVYEVYEDASLSHDWTARLKEKCIEVGIEYFTSPYDFESVDHVDPYLNVYKIGSGDITWIEIIKYIASKGKPVLLATGASDIKDVKRAMGALQEITSSIVLMQCNTNYTADPENFKYINLNVLRTYKNLFPDVILGLSDHTHGHATVLGAIALGARVFEKHFTDDNSREGPDHKFAMNPVTWKEMVDRSYELYYALGDGVKRIEKNEIDTSSLQRRSLRFTKDMKKGYILTKDDLFPTRPITSKGLPPYMLNDLIGRELLKNVETDTEIELSHLKLNQ